MTYRFDDWRPPGRDFVSIYGWQTIPGDHTTLAEMAKGTFERYALRDAGGVNYKARAMQAQKQRPLCGEAG